MQVIINIPEDIYNYRDDKDYIKMCGEEISLALQNSIILPKGHGRLIDSDKQLEKMKSLKDMVEMAMMGAETRTQEAKIEMRVMALANAIRFMDEAEPIIEADRSEEE